MLSKYFACRNSSIVRYGILREQKLRACVVTSNDSVMNFNIRLQGFPDNLLAMAFNFKRLSTLNFDKKAHQLPVVDLRQKNS